MRFSVIRGKHNPQNIGTVWSRDLPSHLESNLTGGLAKLKNWRRNAQGYRVATNEYGQRLTFVPCQ